MDHGRPWFHGSPHELTALAPGSTITQDQALAEAFSHRPSLVSDGRMDGGRLRHNGRLDGWLYVVDEPVAPSDVRPVPGTSLGGNEWLTQRPLRLRKLSRTALRADALLTPDQESDLLERLGRGNPQ